MGNDYPAYSEESPSYAEAGSLGDEHDVVWTTLTVSAGSTYEGLGLISAGSDPELPVLLGAMVVGGWSDQIHIKWKYYDDSSNVVHEYSRNISDHPAQPNRPLKVPPNGSVYPRITNNDSVDHDIEVIGISRKIKG